MLINDENELQDDIMPETMPEATETESDLGADFAEDSEEKAKGLGFNPVRESFWSLIRRFFWMSSREVQQERTWRLEQINEALAHDSDSALLYLLRGELHVDAQRHDLARSDLEKALELAEADVQTARWGISSQSIQDKAAQLLKRL